MIKQKKLVKLIMLLLVVCIYLQPCSADAVTLKSSNYSIKKFGKFLKDGTNLGGDVTFKKSSIDWLVVAKTDKKVLLVSKNIIDYMDITESIPMDGIKKNEIWKKSNVRKWLNGEFYKKAFSSKEKKRIVTTSVKTGKIVTKDKVFLLNRKEAKKYLKSKDVRRAVFTDYAFGDETDGKKYGMWYLRSPGSNPYATYHSSVAGSMLLNLSYVDLSGNFTDGISMGLFDYDELGSSVCGIRPAVWIKK